jgi:hypothetical protein
VNITPKDFVMRVKYFLMAMLLFAFFCTRNPVSPSSSLESTAFSTDLKTGDTLTYYYEFEISYAGFGEHATETLKVSIDTIVNENNNYLIRATISREKWDTLGFPLDTNYENTVFIDSCIVISGIVTKNIDSIFSGMFFTYPFINKLVDTLFTYRQVDTIISLPDTILNCESYIKEEIVPVAYMIEEQIYAKSSRILVKYGYYFINHHGFGQIYCGLISIKHKTPF